MDSEIVFDGRDNQEDVIHVHYNVAIALHYPDVKWLRERMLMKGYEVSYREVAILWASYSKVRTAQWLMTDTKIFKQFIQWLEDHDEA